MEDSLKYVSDDNAPTQVNFTAKEKDMQGAVDKAVDAAAEKTPEPSKFFSPASATATGTAPQAQTATATATVSSNSAFFGQSTGTGNKAAGRTVSLFIGEAVNNTLARNSGVSLMPMTYQDKKEAAKKAQNDAYKASKSSGLMSRSNIAGMSLTGKTAANDKPFVAKGMKISPENAAMLGIVSKELVTGLNNLRFDKSQPLSGQRLIQEVAKGNEDAVKTVRNSPVARQTVMLA